MRNKLTFLLLTLIIPILIPCLGLLAANGCTRVARPTAELMQAWLGRYHFEVNVDAPGAALVSVRGIVLTGSAAASFSLTAPGTDGLRKDIIKRSVRAGEFGAWSVRLFEAEAKHWIRVQRIDCPAAREMFPELPTCPSAAKGLGPAIRVEHQADVVIVEVGP